MVVVIYVKESVTLRLKELTNRSWFLEIPVMVQQLPPNLSTNILHHARKSTLIRQTCHMLLQKPSCKSTQPGEDIPGEDIPAVSKIILLYAIAFVYRQQCPFLCSLLACYLQQHYCIPCNGHLLGI